MATMPASGNPLLIQLAREFICRVTNVPEDLYAAKWPTPITPPPELISHFTYRPANLVEGYYADLTYCPTDISEELYVPPRLPRSLALSGANLRFMASIEVIPEESEIALVAARQAPESRAILYPSPTFVDFLSEQYTLRGVWASYFKESLGGFTYLNVDFVHLGSSPKFIVKFGTATGVKPKSLIPLYGVVKQKKSPRDVYASKVRARVPRSTFNFGDDVRASEVSLGHEIAAHYKSAIIDYKSKGIRLVERMRGKPSAYKYPDAKRLLWVNKQIILPIGTSITIITNSFDVIHSWFIPGLGLKLDCVPGRSTHHTIYIENPGYYYGQCAEICGRRHHHMPIKIYAVSFMEFMGW